FINSFSNLEISITVIFCYLKSKFMARQYDIPTIVTSCLAVAMTIVYFIVPENGKQIFLVFMGISWFIVAICWLALKSTQYMHNLGGHDHDEKKS
ncbi:MAG: hypothetical protein ACRDFB_05355, partial [Rhabdochlamydiaceae bacterium]